MKHASLFSGIGGFDLAAEWMGWKNVFACEIESFGQTVLNNHWNKSTIYEDITTTDFTFWRGRVDVLTGGFPCQPYSLAGLRKGTEDERHLWPEMLRAIREIQPGWVVGENVHGLISWNGGLVFEEVQADLEAEGYEVQSFVLPAASVNAPHKRERAWIVAHDSTSDRWARKRKKSEIEAWESRPKENRQLERGYRGRLTQHADSQRCKKHDIPRVTTEPRFCDREHNELPSNYASGRRRQNNGIRKSRFFDEKSKIPNWENFPTQSPICNGDDGFSTESLRQLIRKDSMGYLSEKEIDKIISEAHSRWTRETIKAGGNAIVPQLALQIFKAIEIYKNTIL